MKSKSQAAMEYLALTGFVMIILMILLVAAYSKMSDAGVQIDMDSAEKAVSAIKEAADFVYVNGYPTKLTIYAYLPSNIDGDDSFIGNNTINLAMWVAGGHTDVWRGTLADVGWDLNGSSSMPSREGYYKFVVESTDYDSIYNGTINIHR